MEMKGVHYILLTPFKDDESIDEKSLRNIVDFQLKAKVQGLAILGFMGEVHKMTDSEKAKVIEIVVDKVNGKIPISVGIRAFSTNAAIFQSQEAQKLGASSVFVAPLNIQDDEVLFEFYSRIVQNIDIPVIIHDLPLAFNTVLSPAFIARLNQKLGINFLKLEDYPSGQKLSKIKEMTNGKMKILGGLGGLYCLEELQRGSEGIMTGFCYVEVLVKIYEKFKNGDIEGAEKTFDHYMPLIRYDMQWKLGMAIRKYVYHKRGIIESNAVRHPAPILQKYTEKELERIIERVGLSITDGNVQEVI